MKLQLERPIVFIDFETTGVDVEVDRIVEFAACKLNPSGQTETVTKRVNPGITIPKGASDVHGITDEMVANEPFFKNYAKALFTMIEGCDLGSFNGNRFDFPLLHKEFDRCGISWDYTLHEMVDCFAIFTQKERRDLAAAVKFYCNKSLEGAHSAKADIEATVDVFIAQMTRYEADPEFPKTMKELALYSNFGNRVADLSGNFYYDEQGTIRFAKGKHKDKLAKSEKGYLDWMLKADFPSNTKKIVELLLSK